MVVSFVLGWENYIVIICFLYAIETVVIRLASILAVSFQAHEEMKYSAISNLITSVSTFVLMVVVIFTPFKLFGVTFVFIFANMLALFIIYGLLENILLNQSFRLILNFIKINYWGYSICY